MTESRRILTPSYRVDPSAEEIPQADSHMLAGCRNIVAELRFDATALPVDELVFLALAAGVQLTVDLRVPNRDKPLELEWIHVWRTLLCPWMVLRSNGPEYLVRWMRETIANTLSHEVDESILLEGVRVFDPHRSLDAPIFTHPKHVGGAD